MKKIFLFILILAQFGFAQTVDILNITKHGRFNSCTGVGLPVITATLIDSDGSIVEDGKLKILDPCGFSKLRVNITNIRWNQNPGANWFHGIFFPEGSGITIEGIVMPYGWADFPTCTGAYCSAGETGGQGFYFDGTSSNSCCSGATTFDGIPHNNFGDVDMDCSESVEVQFDMDFCNSMVETAMLTFDLMGKADGNTGCWSTADGLDNRISFSMNTIASEIPLYEVPPINPEVITECFDGGESFNYIAILESVCGTGDEVTWWDAPEGGNQIGTGSPFLYDTPGSTCPEGMIVYASCCPDGEGCERSPVIIGECLPPSDVPIFEPISPQCAGGANPLPNTSLDGSSGTWSPEYDPFNTTTYTFTPNPGQCATVPVEVTVEILPVITPTFIDIDPICQFSTAPALPMPNEPGITGTWIPAVIETDEPGIYEFTFQGNEDCVEEVTIQVEILPELPVEVDMPLSYCQFSEAVELPTELDNGITGHWLPAEIDTSILGPGVYTFYPDEEHCAVDTPFTIEIIPQPILTPIDVQLLCDDNFDGVYEFDLTELNPQLGAGMSYFYYASLQDVEDDNFIPTNQTTNYSFASLPATIYVIGETPDGCRSVELPIVFEQNDTVDHNPGPFNIEYCPEDTVDLTQFESDINNSGAEFFYYNTLNDAQNGTNEIQNTTTFAPGENQTSVFVRVELVDFCPAFVEISLFRFATPSLELSHSNYTLCPLTSFEATATSDDPDATFEWTMPDGTVLTGPTQTISEIGTYSVVAYSVNGCISETRTLTVVLPAAPVITNIEMGDNYVIIGATNEGQGPMEYSLDGILWQNDNRFNNLIPGETYTIFVRSWGCMITRYTLTILSVPNYFSPNNDGKNDTWEIKGIENSANATLKIFDRYGKIFVETTFNGNYVWNGKYLGNNVPSGDYWYIIIAPSDGIIAERKFVGHITVRNQ